MGLDGNSIPIVTIVTSCYNNERYIYDAIDSVLIQTYPKIEYIITDDASENFPYDEIVSYIENKKGSNIINFKVIKHEKNVGTVKNINGAYKQAEGEIIMPLSADDIFINELVVNRIVNRMVEEKCDVLLSIRIAANEKLQPIRQMPNSNYISKLKKLNTSDEQYKSFLINNYYNAGSGSVLYIRKEYLDKAGYFDEGYRLLEDKPFLTEYCKNGGVIKIAYDIVSILYREVGISSKKSKHSETLRKDNLRYYTRYRDNKPYEFKFYEHRKIDYRKFRNEIKNNIGIVFFRVRFIDLSIMLVYQKLMEKYYASNDIKTMRNMEAIKDYIYNTVGE